MIYLQIVKNEPSQTYGVLVCNQDITSVLRFIPDLTADIVSLTRFVKKCNRSQLSLVHIEDVIEDFKYALEYPKSKYKRK